LKKVHLFRVVLPAPFPCNSWMTDDPRTDARVRSEAFFDFWSKALTKYSGGGAPPGYTGNIPILGIREYWEYRDILGIREYGNIGISGNILGIKYSGNSGYSGN
jgi:hypothetical protein